MPTYSEKLRDPRWQKRRLEIMDRADFTCENCGFGDKTLNVHHRIYRKGSEPWEYADTELECLCETCHEESHAVRRRLDEWMALLPDCALEMAIGYMIGLYLRYDTERGAQLRNHEEAAGIGDACFLTAESVISCADENGWVTGNALVDLFVAQRSQ